jgi:hypothetical protein
MAIPTLFFGALANSKKFKSLLSEIRKILDG